MNVQIDDNLLILDVLGAAAESVYKMHKSLNEIFANAYNEAYAYGAPDSPYKVHLEQCALGAQRLEMSPDIYEALYNKCVEIIISTMQIPDRFIDEKYIVNKA